MKKGIIEIENMEFYAFHGCYHEEQIVGNRFLVDLKFEVDIEKAAKSDDINEAVSYLDVYEIVKIEMMIHSDILENVTDRIINAIKIKFPAILCGVVKVSKCNPPLGGNIEKVSVSQPF